MGVGPPGFMTGTTTGVPEIVMVSATKDGLLELPGGLEDWPGAAALDDPACALEPAGPDAEPLAEPLAEPDLTGLELLPGAELDWLTEPD